MDKRLPKLILSTLLVGAGVAVTYYLFELAVSSSIAFIWNELLDTETRRWLVVPLCVSLTMLYFGVRHRLDPKSEKQDATGRDEVPKPTAVNFAYVLIIGFFSLIAGASLGPEAILIPACIILGSLAGLRFVGKDKQTAGLFGIIGFVALIAAFFDSFIVGMLSLLLARKQFKADIDARMVLLAAVACAGTVVMLDVLEGSAYVGLPESTWRLGVSTIVAVPVLLLAGYLTTYALGAVFRVFQKVGERLKHAEWWTCGLVAGAVLSLIYIIGGPLVQFTGNESIKPMFHEAAGLGFLGLAWLFLLKLLAIGWSKAIGYRGGLVFPSVFIASIVVAIAQLYVRDLNLLFGLIATMAGLLWADSRVKVLL